MLNLLRYPRDQKLLRTPGAPVTKELVKSDTFVKNIEEMKTILAKDGMGLAATQVSWSVRLFLMCQNDKLEVVEPEIFLNPEIIEFSKKKVKEEEGCLSFAGLFIKISRSETIKWRYETLDGEIVTRESSGYYARAIQHECDHLDGKIFVDLASSVQKLKVKKWLRHTR